MARFAKDFRPDREGPSLLSRLHLTKTQRLSAAKWLLYSLVVLVLSVVQDVIMCQVNLFGSTTDLVPCAIFAICIMEGAESGSLFCLIAATLYLFSGTAPGVHVVILIPFFGVVASLFRQNFLRKGFSATLLCASVAIFVYEVLAFALALFVQQTHPGRFFTALVTSGLDCLVIPLLYPVLVSIGKIGGDTWKE